MARLALRPFTFSNGTTIPAGTLVALPLGAVHVDGEIYANPDQFDGFRFSKLRDMEGDAGVTKYQATTTSPEHLPFGGGRHAWWVIILSAASLYLMQHPTFSQ